MRPTVDEWFMQFAAVTAERGTCKRAKVGAVIARGTRLLSVGYVGAAEGEPHCLDEGCLIGPKGGCIRTIHAEANAINWALKLGMDIDCASMYTTLSPCMECAKLIWHYNVSRVFYTTEYRAKEPIWWLRRRGIECTLKPYVAPPCGPCVLSQSSASSLEQATMCVEPGAPDYTNAFLDPAEPEKGAAPRAGWRPNKDKS